MGSPTTHLWIVNKSILELWYRDRRQSRRWPWSNNRVSWQMMILLLILETFETWSELIFKWQKRKLIRPSARYEIGNILGWNKIRTLLRRELTNLVALVPHYLQCLIPTFENEKLRYSKSQKRGEEDSVVVIAVQTAQNSVLTMVPLNISWRKNKKRKSKKGTIRGLASWRIGSHRYRAPRKRKRKWLTSPKKSMIPVLMLHKCAGGKWVFQTVRILYIKCIIEI